METVSFLTNCHNHKPILKVEQGLDKCYKFYFNDNILCCTYNQLVCCSHNRIIEVGDAIKAKCKIHTIHGLLHPTALENTGRKSVCIDIVIRSRSVATLVSGIFCYFRNGYLKHDSSSGTHL